MMPIVEPFVAPVLVQSNTPAGRSDTACVICGQPIDGVHELYVRTTHAEHVNVACADQEARAAFHAECIRSVLSCLISIAGLLLLSFAHIPAPLVLLLYLVSMSAVALHNRRWRHALWSRLPWSLRRGGQQH
jgi:hypothetical protein